MKFHHVLIATLLALYATSGRAQADTLFLIDDTTNTLLRMDPVTLDISVVGSTGVSTGDFGDLTYDPADSTLYWSAGRNNGNIYTIDQATGAATLVGQTGVSNLFGFTYDPANGKFYAMSGAEDLYTIDATNGTATLIGNSGIYPAGLTYNTATNQLIESYAGNGEIYSLDPTTAAATSLGSVGNIDDGGITYDPTRNAYWIDQYGPQNVSKFDATSYTGGVVQTYTDALDGIAYVPEPSTMALLGLGVTLSAFAWLRGKRAAV